MTDNRYFLVAAGVFLLSAYLLLFNLDYVALWHDEGVNAVLAKNWLTTGAFTGWDGRNLLVGSKGDSLNDDLIAASFPPWPSLPSVLGMLVFGNNEVGIRFFHAMLGVLSLPFLWLLLRLDFAQRTRLCVLAFTCFALSTQALLFMRQGRYYADAFLFSLAAFYFYRLYWRDRRLFYLALAAVFTLLNFFNHFGIGTSNALAMASWHLLFCRRETTRRQWGLFAVTGGAVFAVCLAYLLWVGVVGSDRTLEFGEDIYQRSWLERRGYLLFYHARDIISFHWLPLWVAVWWGGYVMLCWQSKKGTVKIANVKKRKKKAAWQDYLAAFYKTDRDVMAMRWAAMALLQVFFTAMVSVQPTNLKQLMIDSRYLLAALPFCAFMVAFCVEWLWQRRNALAGFVALGVFLVSNVWGFPALKPNFFSHATVRWTLPAFFSEVHHPYPTAIQEVVGFLRTHARDDETIEVLPRMDREVLIYYLSEQLIFCCQLNKRESVLPEEVVRTLGIPLYKKDILPTWRVYFGAFLKNDNYALVYQTESYFYPTQRPELELHLFASHSSGGGVENCATIWRLKDDTFDRLDEVSLPVDVNPCTRASADRRG